MPRGAKESSIDSMFTSLRLRDAPIVEQHTNDLGPDQACALGAYWARALVAHTQWRARNDATNAMNVISAARRIPSASEDSASMHGSALQSSAAPLGPKVDAVTSECALSRRSRVLPCRLWHGSRQPCRRWRLHRRRALANHQLRALRV